MIGRKKSIRQRVEIENWIKDHVEEQKRKDELGRKISAIPLDLNINI
jgi:hypothetical protein